MKNNICIKIITILIYLLINNVSYGAESFTFLVTEINVLENGNKIIGSNRGIIKSDNNIVIEADKFEYDKIKNILKTNGNVKIENILNKDIIFSDEAIYSKYEEKITTNGNSKFLNINLIIEADIFSYQKKNKIINAQKNVRIIDKVNNSIVHANNVTYNKNKELIYSKGITHAIINEKYNLNSFDVVLDRNNKILKSKYKTKIITTKNEEYNFKKFIYQFKDEILKAEDVNIISENSKPLGNQNNLKFSSGIFDLKNQSFIAGKTMILLDKNSFENKDNDPRLFGVSSKSDDKITIVNKGVFTSCNIKNDKCTPWSIKAKKIVHDKEKKQLSYENAILKIYDIPIVYFPKFFHPDPTVKRQSGFLQPRFNNSNLNGSSINIPYFYAKKENMDFTFSPTFFDKNIKTLQTEFRQETKNSSLIADFGFTDNFKSITKNKNNSIFHLFTNYKQNLNLDGFYKSSLKIFSENTNKDTYLKIFDDNLLENYVKPKSKDTLFSGIELNLENQKFNLITGISIYENLYQRNSDKYQFNIPYYNFSKNLINNEKFNIDLTSNGNNYLTDTNNLKSTIINNLKIQNNKDFFDIPEIINSYSLYIKNNNSIGKKNSEYSSNLENNLFSMIGLNSSIPLVKKKNDYTNLLTPKLAMRINPYDNKNKNYSSLDNSINTNNIFQIDRLGLEDNFESGKSLTLGFDFKHFDQNDLNTFNFSIASNFRDEVENKIPLKTTLNKKNSNIFGSLDSIVSKNFKLNYDFSIDNKFEKFDYNSIGLNFSLNNFVTDFNFIEENNVIGNANIIENNTTYNFNENNLISFKTRKNRKINLTEFYDLIYEYKIDCLSASIKYNKTYYEDRDLKPSENLMFNITLYPLTSFDQKISPNLYKN